MSLFETLAVRALIVILQIMLSLQTSRGISAPKTCNCTLSSGIFLNRDVTPFFFFFLQESMHIYRELQLFQRHSVPYYLLDLMSLAAPPTLRPTLYSYRSLLSAHSALGLFWGMVWLMRCGSDIESVLLLLISTEAEGREGGRLQDWGRRRKGWMMTGRKRKALQPLFRTWLLWVLWYW